MNLLWHLRDAQVWEATGNGAWSWASGQCWKSWCRDVIHAKVTEPRKGRTDGAAWAAEGPEQGLRSHHQIKEETRNEGTESQGATANTTEKKFR